MTVWRTMRLGSVAETIVPQRDKPKDLSGPIPWLRIEDFDGKHLSASRSGQGVTQEQVRSMPLRIFPPRTVITSCSCTMGATAIAERAVVTNQTFIGLLPDESLVSSDFLYYVMQAKREELQSKATGAIQQYLSQADFRSLRFLAPPISAQRQLAAFLDRETARIDALIEEQQRLIGMLRERRAAVLSTALTPSDSWLRRRIKYIGHTQLGKMLDGGRAARMGDELKSYVRAADVRANGSVNLVDLKQMPFSTAELEVFDLRAGDVLLIEGGATVGRPGFMVESSPGVAFQKTVNRLRVGPTADARFVYWSMLRLYESNYYANHYGAVSFVHLTGEKLREIELDLPSIDEQRRIAAYLDEQTAKIDALIAETERFVELSRERRSALITAAVTGQIDVSDEVA